jgi:hypothetical protein
MMKSNFKWNGEALLKVGVDAAWEGIAAAAIYYENAVKLALNVSNPRPHTTPSLPGEPPRKRTGFLQANIRHHLDKTKLTALVGVTENAKYGLFLELGTRAMEARSFLLSTLKRTLPQLQALARSKWS